MGSIDIPQLIRELLVVLTSGLVAGVVCKRIGMSLLVGYLVVGAIVGRGGMELLPEEHHEIELLAEVGALLLLFSVGIEFSLGELKKLARYFFLGGSVQMLSVALPLTGIAWAGGWTWQSAALTGFACALSSTVLVFRALSELGQTHSPHGKRGLGILLFQDVALVPLLLLVPLLTGSGQGPSTAGFAWLGIKSLLFVAGVLAAQKVMTRWLVPFLASLRSVEIVVLFSLSVTGGLCSVAYALELPPAVGALAAGLTLSGNRLSEQINSILLPFRETFSVVFFVTLGMLLRPGTFLHEPVLLLSAFVGVLTLKTAAAALALRCTGLQWRPALGMGMGLSQLGEFSFLLVAQGLSRGMIDADDYNRILFIAIASLVCTPQLLKLGLRRAMRPESHDEVPTLPKHLVAEHALVIGIGPIGRQVTSRLEMMGLDVGLIDLSPINLQPFAQLGFHTTCGDARDPAVLTSAGITSSRLAVVCVPNDEIALQTVRSLRHLNRQLPIVVRCRFQMRVEALYQVGASGVISEELEASQPIVALCERILSAPPNGEAASQH